MPVVNYRMGRDTARDVPVAPHARGGGKYVWREDFEVQSTMV
jgi:hypothetical protein